MDNDNTTQTETDETELLQRLPLWRDTLDRMIEIGIDYGAEFATSWMEAHLHQAYGSMAFSLAISRIRRELLEHGRYLSGRGTEGRKYVIIQPQDNHMVMINYQNEAIDLLKKGVILGATTDMKNLDEEQTRKHNSVLERLAVRSALMSRTTKELKRLSE